MMISHRQIASFENSARPVAGNVLDLEDERVRLTAKRIVALVRYCEVRGQPFPKYRAVAAAIGVMPWELQKYINTLVAEEILIRPAQNEKRRFLKVNC